MNVTRLGPFGLGLSLTLPVLWLRCLVRFDGRSKYYDYDHPYPQQLEGEWMADFVRVRVVGHDATS